jgi:quinol monooxygenase YgiN
MLLYHSSSQYIRCAVTVVCKRQQTDLPSNLGQTTSPSDKMRVFSPLLAFAATTLAASVSVTEVVNITLAAGASTKVFEKASKAFFKAGAVTFRSSRLVENNSSLRLFVDWESIEDSRAFSNTTDYKKMLKKFKPETALDPVFYPIEFKPWPPVVLDNDEGKGESPFTEFLNFFFPSGANYTEARKANVTETVQVILDTYAPTAPGFTGQTAMGWGRDEDEVQYMGAPHRVFSLGVGWETVEAHKQWMTTPAYAAFLPQLKALDALVGIELRHVSNKVVRANE